MAQLITMPCKVFDKLPFKLYDTQPETTKPVFKPKEDIAQEAYKIAGEMPEPGTITEEVCKLLPG